jgi:hypothetical protein
MLVHTIVLALRRLKQKDNKFQSSLGCIWNSRPVCYIVRPCIKTKPNQEKTKPISIPDDQNT